jgi:hypothetical protein
MSNSGKSSDNARPPAMCASRTEGSCWLSYISRRHGRDAWSAEVIAGMACLDRLQTGRLWGVPFA